MQPEQGTALKHHFFLCYSLEQKKEPRDCRVKTKIYYRANRQRLTLRRREMDHTLPNPDDRI